MKKGAKGALFSSPPRKQESSTVDNRRIPAYAGMTGWTAPASAGHLATCFSLSSSSVLQSMHKVAVGRTSSLFRPISTPQFSQ